MDQDTVRNHGGDSIEAYWRRRAIALVGALTLVALVAWACAGSDGEKQQRPVQNAAALGSPTAASVPTTMPTATVTVTARPTVTPTAPKKAGDACEQRDVVVDFAASNNTFAGKDRPRFQVTAVNTGRRPCTFGVGPKELEVRITSGSDRIWSSAQCAHGSGSSIQMLRRGIPYVGNIVWDRRRSSGDCSGKRAAARPGMYVAMVKTGKAKVGKHVFRLR
jgi:hypothetical protein